MPWFLSGNNRPRIKILSDYLCHGQKSRFVGDGKPPTFNDGILIIGLSNPIIGLIFPSPIIYGNVMGVELIDPIAHIFG